MLQHPTQRCRVGSCGLRGGLYRPALLTLALRSRVANACTPAAASLMASGGRHEAGRASAIAGSTGSAAGTEPVLCCVVWACCGAVGTARCCRSGIHLSQSRDDRMELMKRPCRLCAGDGVQALPSRCEHTFRGLDQHVNQHAGFGSTPIQAAAVGGATCSGKGWAQIDEPERMCWHRIWQG